MIEIEANNSNKIANSNEVKNNSNKINYIEIEDTDFNEIKIENPEYLETEKLYNIIESKKNKFKNDSINHNNNEKYFNKLHFGFGFPHLLLTLFISAINGANSLEDSDDTISKIAFGLGFFATACSAVCVFFNIQQRKNRHHNASLQYSDISNDLYLFLSIRHTVGNLRTNIHLYNEKDKFINSYEPNCSGWVSYPTKKKSRFITNKDNIYDVENADEILLLENELWSEYCNFEHMCIKHKNCEKFWNKLLKLFTFPQLLLTLVVMALNGINSFSILAGIYNYVAFGLGMGASVISVIITIFKFQETSSKHHMASGQLSDLYKDEKVFLLLRPHSVDDLEDELKIINEKEKFINLYKPNFSPFIKNNK